jgi:hypothetical protein
MLGDGDDEVSAGETDCRLDTDKVVDVRGRQNGARCLAQVRILNAMAQIITYLRAKSGESQTKRRRNTRTTRRATRVLVRVVGSFSLSTVCRPSISAVVRAIVGPLREIGLAEDDSTSFSQLGSQSGIMRNLCAEQSERSSCESKSDDSSLLKGFDTHQYCSSDQQ